MLEGIGLIINTDMEVEMQLQAMASTSEALDLFDVLDHRSIASHIKKVMRNRSFWPCNHFIVFFFFLPDKSHNKIPLNMLTVYKDKNGRFQESVINSSYSIELAKWYFHFLFKISNRTSENLLLYPSILIRGGLS